MATEPIFLVGALNFSSGSIRDTGCLIPMGDGGGGPLDEIAVLCTGPFLLTSTSSQFSVLLSLLKD